MKVLPKDTRYEDLKVGDLLYFERDDGYSKYELIIKKDKSMVFTLWWNKNNTIRLTALDKRSYAKLSVLFDSSTFLV